MGVLLNSVYQLRTVTPMADCRWNHDEFCVNADCPMCADYCPVADYPDVCRFEDRGDDYRIGDVCIYGFGSENKSRAIVEIVRILSYEQGVVEVKFLKVFVDDTGNGLFDYLLKSGKTMNASFQYLKNITPRTEGEG